MRWETNKKARARYFTEGNFKIDNLKTQKVWGNIMGNLVY